MPLLSLVNLLMLPFILHSFYLHHLFTCLFVFSFDLKWAPIGIYWLFSWEICCISILFDLQRFPEATMIPLWLNSMVRQDLDSKQVHSYTTGKLTQNMVFQSSNFILHHKKNTLLSFQTIKMSWFVDVVASSCNTSCLCFFIVVICGEVGMKFKIVCWNTYKDRVNFNGCTGSCWTISTSL